MTRLVIVFLMLLTFGPSSALPTGSAASGAPDKVKQARPSVFTLVVAGDYLCTAFAIKSTSGSTVLVSAGHCATKLKNGDLVFALDQWSGVGYQARLRDSVNSWPSDDYSVYDFTGKTPDNSLEPASKQPDIGDEVFTFGGPAGLAPTLTSGLVSGPLRCLSDEECEKAVGGMNSLTMLISGGVSGSPALDSAGHVFGIIVGSNPKVFRSLVVKLPQL